MGVSRARALWSPSLQARRSLLISSTAGSPGCALGIAYRLNCTTVIRSGRILRLFSVEAHNMKTTLTSIAAGSLLSALAIAQPRYTVIDLGALGGTYSFGFGINSA